MTGESSVTQARTQPAAVVRQSIIGAVRTVVVVGGGISGIACALRLAETGVAVTLLETRKKLGGRATSFEDVRSGLVIDNCQHVAMGCCTNYLDLCRRLGVLDKIRWQDEIFWVEAGGRTSVLRRGMLPAPAHFTGSFVRAAFLTATEKLGVARAMRAIIRADRREFATITFGEWLGRHRQRSALIRKFWAPIVISACNLDPNQVAASVALHVFQEGFLEHRDAARVGVSAVPLVELYGAAETALRSAGGELRLGTSVEQVYADHVVTNDGRRIDADAVVCTVPPERATRLVRESVRATDSRFGPLGEVRHSPILGVHLTFDRSVLHMHSAVLVERDTQWLFRKDEAGTRVHAVISAADEWMALTEDEITRRVLRDIHACFPASRDAKVLSSRAVKEKFATYAPTPDVEARRPATLGPLGRRGVILAGDYVQTGWPATMEGAARSGYMAAAAVLDREPSALLAPSLQPSRLYRLLAGARSDALLRVALT